jgi:hypothetical protein
MLEMENSISEMYLNHTNTMLLYLYMDLKMKTLNIMILLGNQEAKSSPMSVLLDSMVNIEIVGQD